LLLSDFIKDTVKIHKKQVVFPLTAESENQKKTGSSTERFARENTVISPDRRHNTR
jgi:hypothetical protein